MPISTLHGGRNQEGGSQVHSWQSAGWITEDLDLASQRVTFSRNPKNSRSGRSSSKPPRITRSVKKSLDGQLAYSWDMAEKLSCLLELHWLPLGRLSLDSNRRLVFPAVEPVSGLYRFRVRHKDGSESRYVGEAENLRRRFQHYRTPGNAQETNIRINSFLAEALSKEAEISVSIATKTAFIEIASVRNNADFSSKTIRRLFENFAQVTERDVSIESLNR